MIGRFIDRRGAGAIAWMPLLAGRLLDSGLSAKGTFFVFAVFPVAMVVLLTTLGRVQRGLPAGPRVALSLTRRVASVQYAWRGPATA